ncbi:alcohol dehydrogenase catalytic domain-containing protein [Tanticharoenia sakaeratensis]|uniref:alcohol dehydrogenase n=1 Tax=Tanticharoenia sakaeratensis NBRC 103193 TaxID=1231623 RepID=A0A0D6MLC5_9PROT|nr:zinc-binding dehydrogenase [Tanticharoenia sakaeratensis]GAN54474.1 alcohol dehydrogenase GroES domain-containing protein [Tanticharoenia sakaeratensis NBRC 103193]
MMTNAGTMRAVRLLEPRAPFVLKAVSIPQAGPGEVRIRIGACGICRTELHLRDGGLDLGARDFTVGHEIAGIVDQAGEGVSQDRLGEKAVVYYYQGCGHCRYCRSGETQLCPTPVAQPGFSADGGYAEYIVVPAANAVTLPAAADLAEAAPLGCAGSTAVHACGLARIRTGDWVLVNGAGGVGLAIVQVARAAGARVIAVGLGAQSLALATELGAEAVIDAASENVLARVTEITGEGVDAAFELVGREATMRIATEVLRRRGRLVLIGYTGDDYVVHPVALIVREIAVMGSVGSTLQDLHDAVALYARGLLRSPIAQRLPLDAFEEGLALTERGHVHGRVALLP